MSKKAVLVAMTAAFLVAVTGVLIGNFFIAWVGWGLIFGILEWYALKRANKGDTLSEQVWLGTLSSSKFWKVFWTVGLAMFLVWLAYHFFTGNPWFTF